MSDEHSPPSILASVLGSGIPDFLASHLLPSQAQEGMSDSFAVESRSVRSQGPWKADSMCRIRIQTLVNTHHGSHHSPSQKMPSISTGGLPSQEEEAFSSEAMQCLGHRSSPWASTSDNQGALAFPARPQALQPRPRPFFSHPYFPAAGSAQSAQSGAP